MSARSCRWCRKARWPSATICRCSRRSPNPGSRPTTPPMSTRCAKGVTFGDGSPLTADDVVASFQYHMNPKSGSQLAAFFGSVDTVTASGDNEVTVKLKAPNVQFQYTPAHMAGFIFSKKQLEEFPEDIGTPDALPLGTGPYKLVEFTPADTRRAGGARRLLGAEAGRQAHRLLLDPGPPDPPARRQERRHRRHLRPGDLRHRPVEGAGQRRCHHRAVARRVHADDGPVGGAVRRHPCAQGDLLCGRSRGPGEGAAEGQWRGGDRAQSAGDVGRHHVGRTRCGRSTPPCPAISSISRRRRPSWRSRSMPTASRSRCPAPPPIPT